MKIKHLVESVDHVSQLEQIGKLDFFKNFPTVRFYRGAALDNTQILEMPFKFKTAPRDTMRMIHDAVNELAIDKFDIPIRSLVYSYTYAELTETYGNTFMIVPKGEMTVYYNEDVSDFTSIMSAEQPGEFVERIMNSFLQDIATLDIINDIIDDEEVSDELESIMDDMEGMDFDDIVPTSMPSSANNKGLDSYISYINGVGKMIMQHIKRESENIPSDFFPVIEREFAYILRDEATSIIDDYIGMAVDTEDQNGLKLNADPEMMLYMPDGFWLIPTAMLHDPSTPTEIARKLLGKA